MTIDSFIRNQDSDLVQLRWQGLGEKGKDLLGTLTPAVCRFSTNKEIKAFGEVVNIQALPATRKARNLQKRLLQLLQGSPLKLLLNFQLNNQKKADSLSFRL